jgi:hypothetical protein
MASYGIDGVLTVETRDGSLWDSYWNGKDFTDIDLNVKDDNFLQSQYNFNYRVFPEDLTNNDVGHYMVININAPTHFTAATGEVGTFRTAYKGAPYRATRTGDFSKVDILRFGKGPNATSAPLDNIAPGTFVDPFRDQIGTQGAPTGERLAAPRATRRVAESIALFMPNPIIYTSLNDYPDVTIASMVKGALLGAIGGATSGASPAIQAAGELASTLVNAGGQAAQLAGNPINPRIAVLYASSPLRQFNFDILMAPKSESESITMKEIIATLRTHAVPEIDPATYGFTWIPPAEFDITFYNKGVEQKNIPRINTCVLTRIDVDYAPQGVYATFQNGHPVMCRLTLGFMEVEVLHKRRVLQGF